MKRALLLVSTLATTLIVPAVLAATPAAAQCAPSGPTVFYKISNKSFQYYPTNVASDWASLRHGGSINYSQTKTMTVSASVTATVSTEANAIFAKASASLGITVGKSWSTSQTWSYSANVPADVHHKYRLHAYHYTASFTVAKKQWYPTGCTYRTLAGWPQRVTHAPIKSNRNVWREDKAKA
jgi:hypothetical protein